jgi:hypothetical protein
MTEGIAGSGVNCDLFGFGLSTVFPLAERLVGTPKMTPRIEQV